MLPLNTEASREAVDQANEALRGYQGMPLISALAELLDTMVMHYRVVLSTAPIEDVKSIQAALKQCLAIRSSLARDGERPIIF